jgi:hypothetical protein
MKRCPTCGQTYTDADINFCLNDGELLSRLADGPFGEETGQGRFADDSPPTVLIDRSKVTNQTSWQPSQPPVPWQSSSPVYQPPIFGATPYMRSQDQTLSTVALVLGLASILMVCCFGGIWLGIPAAVVGYLGMRKADVDPARYGGRGMAVAGLVIGIATALISFIHFIFAVLAG